MRINSLTEHDASTGDVARTIEIQPKPPCEFVLRDFPTTVTRVACCKVSAGKGNRAAREIRTFDLQVVTRELHFRENLPTAHGLCRWQSK